MAQKTIYTCDRCGASKDDDPEFVARISLLDSPRRDNWGGYIATRVSADWCRDCHIAVGTLQPFTGRKDFNDGMEPAPLPTLEDIIRGIIREEIECADP